jgi:hypothetical protein
MSIPQATVDRILVKCARHCCVCRRHRPLLLQVHHIEERSDGGTHEEDNLIATCISCHAEVHTSTKLTRRFTRDELKGHRNAVYELVAKGKLPMTELEAGTVDRLVAKVLAGMPAKGVQVEEYHLTKYAVKILLSAVASESAIHRIEFSGGFSVYVGDQALGTASDQREMASMRHAFDQLLRLGLLEVDGRDYYVSYTGYLVSDSLISFNSLGP